MSDRNRLIALIASLALNVFLIGAVGAVLVLGGGRPKGPLPVLRHAAEALGPADHARFLALLRAQGRIARPDNQRAHALRLEGWGTLGDPVFDPAGVKAKLAQARQINLTTRGAVDDAVIDFAANLPASQRAVLGDALRATILQNNGSAESKKRP